MKPNRLFDCWWTDINRENAVGCRVGHVSFRLVSARREVTIAQVAWESDQSLWVEVSRDFLREFRAGVRRELPALRAACLKGESAERKYPMKDAQLVASVCDLAESFLILHELFHVCCGHVSWLRTRDRSTSRFVGYDEVRMGMAANTAALSPDSRLPKESLRSSRRRNAISHPPEGLEAAYYREIEADNSALQWLMRSNTPLDFGALRGPIFRNSAGGSGSILQLDGASRIVAFRLLVVAVWLVTEVLERGRARAQSDRPSTSVLGPSEPHRLPSIRFPLPGC